jgi:hypothetical protein
MLSIPIDFFFKKIFESVLLFSGRKGTYSEHYIHNIMRSHTLDAWLPLIFICKMLDNRKVHNFLKK